MDRIDTQDMDRTTAILIYDNKIYCDDNHQCALYTALTDDGKSFFDYIGRNDINEENPVDYIYDNIDDIAEITDSKSKANEIFTFDIYDDKYIIAHYSDNLYSNLDLVLEYADMCGLRVGYFEDATESECLLIN